MATGLDEVRFAFGVTESFNQRTIIRSRAVATTPSTASAAPSGSSRG